MITGYREGGDDSSGIVITFMMIMQCSFIEVLWYYLRWLYSGYGRKRSHMLMVVTIPMVIVVV